MARKPADWSAIKADFLATGMSYEMLAKKWGLSISAVKKKAARERWQDDVVEVAKNSEPDSEPESELDSEPSPECELVDAATLATEMRANRVRKLMETTDAMMDRVIEAMGVIEPGNTYALSMLIRSLKDLREIQGLNKSALDLEEQRIRIDLMKQQRQQAIHEPITVEFVNTDGAET